MLQIKIPIVSEGWDEKTETFVEPVYRTIQLEHSLVSLSKWESKWCKPFLTKQKKSYEETVDYIKCMTLTQNVDADVYNHLTNDNIDKINKYIEAPMTATWFTEDKKGKSSREQVTSEIIYYWMITLGIPFECQKWHLNRLLTLIRVCNVKNQPNKKMSTKELISRNAALNAARRKQMNSKG